MINKLIKILVLSGLGTLNACKIKPIYQKQEGDKKVCLHTAVSDNQTRLMKKSFQENTKNYTENIDDCDFLVLLSIIKNENQIPDTSGLIFTNQIIVYIDYSIFELKENQKPEIKKLHEEPIFGRNKDIGGEFYGIGVGRGMVSKEITNKLSTQTDKFTRENDTFSALSNKIVQRRSSQTASFKINPVLFSASHQEETDVNEDLGKKIGEDVANEVILEIETYTSGGEKK